MARKVFFSFRYDRDVELIQLCSVYEWVGDDGWGNMPLWIEATAKTVGR